MENNLRVDLTHKKYYKIHACFRENVCNLSKKRKKSCFLDIQKKRLKT